MDSVISLVELGGPVVAILGVVSVLALAVIIWKFIQFIVLRVGSKSRAERAVSQWHSGRREEAFQYASRGRSITARRVTDAMSMLADGRSRDVIEERLIRRATNDLHNLQSGFRFLDAVAQLSPLLGLFGTVLGMIEAFRELQAAGSSVDPSILAGGIWVALLTTAAGLAVAMPVSLFLTWMESRIEDERVAIETLTSDILASEAELKAA
ncbi:MAG: MotA/TolQ/ExbB proton channel family protein [Pseudomonadota bacterium]